MQRKNVLFRFLQYLVPYNASIVLAMGCALIVSVCEYGPIHICAETLDSLKHLEGFSQSTDPVSVRFFNIKYVYDGIDITLNNAAEAYRFFFWLFIGLLCLVFLKGIFVYGSDFLMQRVANKLSFLVRNDLYEKVISSPLGTLSEYQSGDVMTRVTDDVQMLQQSVTATASIMRAFIKVVFFLTMMFIQNILISIISILVLPLVAYLISRIGAQVRKASTEIQQSSSNIYSQLKETLSGINIIKSFTSENIEKERFKSITSSQYSSAIRRARFASLLPPVIDWLAAVGIVTVLGFVCWNVIIGKLTVGWFAGYMVLAAMMYKPIKIIGSVNNVLQQSLASAERILPLLELESEIDNESGRQKEISDVQGTVQFQDISFAYRENPVINNVSFTANQGEIIALVGPSGSGKTTLLNLLQRFYTVDSGRILIDDMPINEVSLKSLRRNIALVPQDTFLFDGTVLDNIKYGSPRSSRHQVIEAAKKANAHNFINKLPEGYNTEVGEAGGTLSGGEKQRVSIARAILKNAPILVLDEATSALDTQSEAIIQDSLTNLMGGRTCFIIAHRLSTVMQADNIFVISDGKIVERGKHAELMDKGGLYRDFCEQQMLK